MSGSRPPRDVAINLRVNAEDVRAIDRMANLSGATRSEVVRAAIAAVIAEPELVLAPPLDEPSMAQVLEAEARAIERQHFG